MQSRILFSTTAFVCAATLAPVLAGEQGVIRARLDLDKVQQRLPRRGVA